MVRGWLREWCGERGVVRGGLKGLEGKEVTGE